MVNNASASQPNLDYSDASSPRATGFSIEPARKKRGRPRKDSGSGGGGGDAEGPSSENPSKKARGRPPVLERNS
ncbi:hypothetical protein HAX54_038700 [Datura stramonium]|uniref:AT-hook motif nuclear-localized protein n=1 Tax=Datura stramonium TaxID=4076 RepID=A0ABS8RMV4_DATST|nr:hypothetical protein [Datura stramonium]